MAKSREEDLMSRIFAWSQKCLPADSLLVARRKICSRTKLDNTFWICKISVTSKGWHRHHTPLDVTPGKAHHHVGDSCGLVTMSCLTLCDLMDYGPPDSSLWDFQARILEWIAISFSADLPNLRFNPMSLVWACGFFIVEPPGKPHLGDNSC